MLSGIIDGYSIHSTLQLPQLMSATGKLVLDTTNGIFDLYYEDGQLTHVEAGGKTGDEAFFHVVRYATSGSFRLEPAQKAAVPSINKPIQLLLMLAAKEIDERRNAEPPKPVGPTVEEKITKIIEAQKLLFAIFIPQNGDAIIVNPEKVVGIDVKFFSETGRNFLQKLYIERIVGSAENFQFAIGKHEKSWFVIGIPVDIPLGMLPGMLKQAMQSIDW